MSELILPQPESTPNFRTERERSEYLNGKATRLDMMMEVMKINNRVNEELQKIASTMSRIYSMARVNGLQLDTLVRLVDKATATETEEGFKEKFEMEFSKTLKMVGFLDSLIEPGKPEKPIREKIEAVRAWNANEDVRRIEGLEFGLDQYIMQHPSEFTQEEVDKFNEEFKMEVTLPLAVPEKKVEENNGEAEQKQEDKVSV